MGCRWLLERRVARAFPVAARGERLPGDPRPGRLLTELPADGNRECPRSGIQIDTDALAECRDLDDRHPDTVDHPGIPIRPYPSAADTTDRTFPP